MKFTKMHGAGNDFIIINNMDEKLSFEELRGIAKKLCQRRFSIGADGLMVVEAPSQKSNCEVEITDLHTWTSSGETDCDFRMLFFNADGSEGEMCGNGARCIARYGYEFGLAGERQRIETKSGIVIGERIGEDLYKVRLNPVTHIAIDCLEFEYPAAKQITTDRLELNDIAPNNLPLACEDGLKENFLRISYVELGNPGLPHAVVELKGMNQNQKNKSKRNCEHNLNSIKQLAKALRHHNAFPKGANINFYEICRGDNLNCKSHLCNGVRDEVYVLTYERGVEDFTLACGTGVASTVAVLAKQNLVSGKGVQVHTLGGTLVVDIVFDKELGEEHLYLTGGAALVATGHVRIENYE